MRKDVNGSPTKNHQENYEHQFTKESRKTTKPKQCDSKLNGQVFLVFLILLVDLIAFTIILPLLPSLLDRYDSKQDVDKDSSLQSLHNGMNKLKKQFGMPGDRQYNNVLIGGILGSIFSSLQFLASPFIGILSDFHGRKPILLISMAGTLTSYIIWMQAHTFTLFLISRIVGGLAKGSVTICTAMMADLTTKETRGKAMALVGVAFSIGFSTGPLVGAYFATRNKSVMSPDGILSQPPLVCIGLQLIAMFLVIFLKESTDATKKSKDSHILSTVLGHLNPFGMLSKLASPTKSSDNRMHMVWSLGVTQFFYLVLFSGLEFTLTFLTHQRFHFTRQQQGKLFLFIGIVMSITQGGYVRRVKHGKEKRVAMQGIIVLIPAMILVALANSITVVYIGVLLYSFGAATVIPCLTTMVSKQAGDDDNGEILGVFRSLGALARAFGPFLSCSLYWSVGSTICYFVGGVLFLVPFLLLARIPMVTKAD